MKQHDHEHLSHYTLHREVILLYYLIFYTFDLPSTKSKLIYFYKKKLTCNHQKDYIYAIIIYRFIGLVHIILDILKWFKMLTNLFGTMIFLEQWLPKK